MHSISTAAPSHVKIGPDRYDVVCWTLGEGGRPKAWIIVAGVLMAYNPDAGHMLLIDCSAQEGYDA